MSQKLFRLCTVAQIESMVLRRKFNPKRRIAANVDEQELVKLAARVIYKGSPEHKRFPGSYGLTPPTDPRPDKTPCDGVNLTELGVAQELLREGVRRGLVSVQERAGLPQNIWAVSEADVPLEAQLENQGNATYHGYPMQKGDRYSGDPLYEEVLRRWKASGQK